MATWLNSIGDWNTNVNASIFGGKNTAGVMQQASGFGKAMGGLGINANNIGGIANTIGQIGTGLLAGQNQTGVGNALQTIGGLASNIPGVGGLIGAGVGVVGGLINAAFGSHINDEFVQQTQLGANQVGSQVFNANTNGDLLNDWQNMTQMSNVSKSEVGSDGWFSDEASSKTRELNEKINAANKRQLANFNIAAQNVDTSNDLRILQNMAAYGGPISSFRKYYADGGLFNTPQFFTFEPQTYDKGGYLNQAKALIRQNEGWSSKPYSDSPKGKNWRSVGYGFNDSGFRDKYPEGISKHYEHGITKKQAEEELDYFLNKAEKQLKSIYGKQWSDFTDSQKAAILDTYYQRPASVDKGSRFYKAVTAGEDAGRYLGVAGYNKRNKVRQDIFDGGYSGYGDWSDTESDSNSSSLQEVTPFTPVVHDLDLSGITPTEAKALELNLTSPTFDLSMFGKPMTAPTQQAVPTVGTVEDFLSSYGDFNDNLFKNGGKLNGNTYDGGGLFGNETVDAVASFLPVVGTLEDAYQLYQNPSWENAGWLALSLGSDIFTGGMAGRAIKAARMANKAVDAAKAANKVAAREYRAARAVNGTNHTRQSGTKVRQAIKAAGSAGDSRNAAIKRANQALFEAGVTSGLDQGLNGFINAAQMDMLPILGKAFGGELNSKDMNIFDFGGGITHGVNWDTGVDYVAEGQSHEQNPYGGVMVGQDEEGTPNLVEEGEYIWNGDYVFSRRMKVPKKLREKYHLKDDATFADAIKVLTKESEERPLDNISRRTQDHILGEFADSQEELRAAKAQRAMEKEQQLQEDFLTGVQFGLGGALFADGGDIHIDPSKKGTFKAQASKMGMGVQEAASHILANKENYSPAMVKKANFARNASHWHEDGGFLDNGFDANLFYDGGGVYNGTKLPSQGAFEPDSKYAKKLENMGFNDMEIDEIITHSGKRPSMTYHPRTMKYKSIGWKKADETPLYTQEQLKAEENYFKNAANKRARQDYSQPERKMPEYMKKVDWSKPIWGQLQQETPFTAYSMTTSNTTPTTSSRRANNGKKAVVSTTPTTTSATTPEEKLIKSGKKGTSSSSKKLTNSPVKGTKAAEVTPAHSVPADYNWEQEAPWLFGNVAAPTPQEQLSPMEQIARDKSTPTRSVSATNNGTNFGVTDTTPITTRGGVTDYTGEGSGLQRSPFKSKQTWTRYAPLVMSGLMGLKEMLTPADYGNADSIMESAYQVGSPVSIGTEYLGDYRKRDPFDERYLMNIINQRGAATNRNMMNLSGGNRAAAMAGILSNDLTTQMSLAEAARQAYLANRADDAQVAEFNRGTNQFNATAQNQRNQFLAGLNSQRQQAMLSGISQGARLRQAIKDQRDAAISANLTNLTQSLGDLGKENGFYNMLGGLNDEGILKYFYGDDWNTKFNG